MSIARRSTAVLLGLAVLLTAWAVFFERPLDPAGGTGRLFPDLEPADFTALEIRRRGAAGGEGGASRDLAVRLERRGEFDWWIVEPIDFPAFLPRVEGLLFDLLELVRIDTIPPGTEGFARAVPAAGPELAIRFSTRRGTQHAVEVGRDYPAGAEYVYARVDGEVIVTRARLRRSFTVGLEELRSRAIVPVAPPDATGVEVEAQREAWNKTFLLQEREGEAPRWVLSGAVSFAGTLADRELLHRLLVELNSWKIESFEDDAPEDLAAYGLEAPWLTVEVSHREGRVAKVAVGKRFERHGEKLVYLRHLERPAVYTASAEPLAWLEKEAEAFRTRHVFDFAGAEIVRIDCEGPQAGPGPHRFVLRLEDAPDEAGKETAGTGEERRVWALEDEAGERKLPADQSLVRGAASELRSLLIEKFLERADWTQATAGRLTVGLDTGEEYRLLFGPRSADERDRGLEVYEARRSQDASVFLVESLWPRRLALGPYVFRNRRLSRLNPAAVVEIEVAEGETSWRLGRVPGHDWALPASEPLREGKDLDQERIHRLLLALAGERFQVWEFLPDLKKESYELCGIGTSRFRRALNILQVDGPHDGFRRLTVGHPVPPSFAAERARAAGTEPSGEVFHFGRTDHCDVPFTLRRDVPSYLEELAAHLREITGKE